MNDRIERTEREVRVSFGLMLLPYISAISSGRFDAITDQLQQLAIETLPLSANEIEASFMNCQKIESIEAKCKRVAAQQQRHFDACM